MRWAGQPRPTEGAPRSAYAHWAWEQAAASGTILPGYLSGDQRGVAAVEALPRDDPPPAPTNRVVAIDQDVGGRDLAIPLLLPQRMINPTPPTSRLADWHQDIDAEALGESPTPGTVFVAVIDEAIAFAHERFRRRNGQDWRSRINYLWLQGAGFADPRGVLPVGRELHSADIEALLQRHSRHGIVDEEALYRDPASGLAAAGVAAEPGYLQQANHGTAVLDLAGGLDADDALGDRLRLMAVALPAPVVGDTTGAFAELYIVMAIQRLLAHVKEYEKQATAKNGTAVRFPLVVNVSLALTNGPKDGGGLLERFMDREAKERAGTAAALHFVVPTGNHRLARTRAASAGRAPLDLGWQIPPDDATANFLEIWGPRLPSRPPAPALQIGLAPPAAALLELPPVDWGTFANLVDGDRLIARAYRHWVPSLPAALAGAQPDAGRERVTLVVPPTVPRAADIASATPGRWQVTVTSRTGGAIDVFVQRDDSLPGYRRHGRQSRLAHAAYRERDPVGRVLARDVENVDRQDQGPISRSGTISPFATGRAAIVVGGCFAGSGNEVPYSGLPVAGAEGAPRPDVLYPADRSPVNRGVLVATTRSGGRTMASGVSFAAAAATRVVGHLLLDKPAASRDDCVATLNDHSAFDRLLKKSRPPQLSP